MSPKKKPAKKKPSPARLIAAARKWRAGWDARPLSQDNINLYDAIDAYARALARSKGKKA